MHPSSYDEQEMVPDHLAETSQIETTLVMRDKRVPGWQRVLGLLSLFGATSLTIAAVFLMIAPGSTPPAPDTPPSNPVNENVETIPSPTPQPVNQVTGEDGDDVRSFTVLPTLSPADRAAILNAPVESLNAPVDGGIEAVRDIYNPFTIIPERTRSGVEEYTVVSGDTIFSIAERYGLQPETIAWGNDRSIIGNLQPGQHINILPVDGVYYQVLGDKTIGDIAAEYFVDPYVIIDSEFNNLFGKNPDDSLPSGTWLVIPGAQAEQISWNPVVERIPGASGSGGSGGGKISFAPGDPGSCGLVDNPGGGGGWWPPLANYTWMRGFTSWHTGVDLSAPAGTPVFAANGGSVIFAGWNSWGYGYTVVLAHGPFTTLYGHLSEISVGCAQYVTPGQFIGAVGSTGNSSGPHLHFETRYNDVPQDPTYTMAF